MNIRPIDTHSVCKASPSHPIVNEAKSKAIAIKTVSRDPMTSLKEVEKSFKITALENNLPEKEVSEFYKKFFSHPNNKRCYIEQMIVGHPYRAIIENSISSPSSVVRRSPEQITRLNTLLANPISKIKKRFPTTFVEYMKSNFIFFNRLLKDFIDEKKVSEDLKQLPLILISAMFTLQRCPDLSIQSLEDIKEKFEKEALKSHLGSLQLEIFYTHLFSHPQSIGFSLDSLLSSPFQQEKIRALFSNSSKIQIFKELELQGKITKNYLLLPIPIIKSILLLQLKQDEESPFDLKSEEREIALYFDSLITPFSKPHIQKHVFLTYLSIFSHPQIMTFSEIEIIEILNSRICLKFRQDVIKAFLDSSSTVPISLNLLSIILRLTSVLQLPSAENLHIYSLVCERLKKLNPTEEMLHALLQFVKNTNLTYSFSDDEINHIYNILLDLLADLPKEFKPSLFLANNLRSKTIDPRALWMILKHPIFQGLHKQALDVIATYFSLNTSNLLNEKHKQQFKDALRSHPSYKKNH